jgi:hypothetical protein
MNMMEWNQYMKSIGVGIKMKITKQAKKILDSMRITEEEGTLKKGYIDSSSPLSRFMKVKINGVAMEKFITRIDFAYLDG